jgi:hypothetical protein
VSVFVLSIVVLIPDQSNSALGAELIADALLNLGMAIPRQLGRLKATVPSERTRSGLRIAIYDGAALLITAAGVILAADVDFAFYLLAASVIAYTLVAIANSWSLTLVDAGRVDTKRQCWSHRKPSSDLFGHAEQEVASTRAHGHLPGYRSSTSYIASTFSIGVSGWM